MKAPDEAKLYEAALNHLARYPATEAGLARVLARKIDRWAKLQTAEADDIESITAAARASKSNIRQVITRLKSANILNDEAFVTSRAKRLTRAGKSRRGILANLSAKGIEPGTASTIVTDDPERELAAACAYLRRRRAGPFGDTPELKILGAMSRVGFTPEVARKSLKLTKEEAENKIKALGSLGG